MERLAKQQKIEEVILERVGDVGSIHDLGWVIGQTYAALGAEFFDGATIGERKSLKDGQVAKSPAAEIALAVHSLLEWSVLSMTADRRLKVLRKNKGAA